MIRDLSGRTTGRHLATVGAAVAGAGLATAVATAAWRLAGAAVPAVLLASRLLVELAFQGGAALLLAGRRRERPWSLALLLAPSLLAALPALDRAGGGLGVLAGGLAVAGIVGIGSRGGSSRQGRGLPLLAAPLGAALGAAVAAVWGVGQLEAEPLAAGVPVRATFWALAAAAAAVVLGADGRLPLPSVPSRRASLVLAAAGLAVAVGIAASGPPTALPAPPAGPIVSAAPPVVLVVLDTLRADHLAAYGYRRDTMPALEGFARRYAARVERSLASAPSSLESHASMFTGLLPARHGAHKPDLDDPHPPAYAYPLAPGVPTLARLLQRAGYWTVGISANFGPLDPHFGLGRGFDVYEAVPGWKQRAARLDPFRGALDRRWPLAILDRLPPFAGSEYFELSVPYRRAGEVVDRGLAAIDRADRAGGRPFFLFLNLLEPHHPYRPPRRWTRIYPGIRRPGLRRLADDQAEAAAVMTGRRPLREADRAAWIAAYDSELSYLDSELARLLERLRRHPRFGDMLVVVTADHGEAFGEHGAFRHSTQLYDEMERVPLFVKPGRRHPAGFAPGAVVAGPFQSVDLFPTVLAHAGLPVPAGIDGVAWGEGRRISFAEAYVHPPARAYGPRFRRELRLAEADGWKLIVASDGPVELYDLARDPGERVNVAAAHPEKVAALRAALRAALPPARRRGAPPSGDSGDPDEAARALRSLGYAQ